MKKNSVGEIEIMVLKRRLRYLDSLPRRLRTVEDDVEIRSIERRLHAIRFLYEEQENWT